MNRLRLVSWNINSLRARAPLVERLIAEVNPDVICLQETKVENRSFPHDVGLSSGYIHKAIHGQRMHHGVAILARIPLEQSPSQDWQANGQARHVGAILPNGVRLENIYAPAGGDVPDRTVNEKFGQKLDYYDRLTDWSAQCVQPTILVGDLNIAPLPEDVWSHKALLGVVSHTPVEVAAMAALQASHQWVDLGRHFTPAPAPLYTWWSYRAEDWRASNRGRRLDHIWISPALLPFATACWVLEDARGWDKPSDHAPVIADFAW